VKCQRDSEDPHELALIHSGQVRELVHKAMAFVFVDGEPVDLVHCFATLHASITAAFRRRPHEYLYVSIVWLPLGGEVSTVYLVSDLWDALCENEESMCAYFEITGLIDREDDDANG
jgi:hypothetical protein